MYPTDVFPQLALRKLSPRGRFKGFYRPTFCYCLTRSHLFLQSPGYKGIVGPWRRALPVNQLMDDRPNSAGMAVLQAHLPAPLYSSAGRHLFAHLFGRGQVVEEQGC